MARPKWLDTLFTVAPAIASAVGTPIAGVAVQAIEQVFGLGPNSTEDQQAAAVLGATPDQLLALKKADTDFQEHMKQLDIDLERISGEDRASARAMQIANKDWIPGALALTITIAFFGLVAYVATHEVPVGNKEIITLLIGSIGTAWITIIGFYFGSTSSSHQKDLTITKLAQ